MSVVYRKFAVSFVLGLALAFQAGCKSEEVDLTIFHTNDIHCYLKPSPVAPFGFGGVAKLATRLYERRAATPNAHLTLDAGDWCEGQWYYSVNTGAGMLQIFDIMGFDAAVVGNHDYLSGPDELIDTVRDAAAKYPVLGANYDFTSYSDEARFRRYILPSTIVEKGGLKIGIIGLSTMEAPFSPFLKPVQATDPVESAQQLAKTLRPQVDVLLVLSHNSFGVNEHIARATLGVDAVISGHSHRKVPEAVLIDNAGRQVPVVETGEHSQFLGELRLAVDAKKKVVRFKDYELHPISPEIADDPAVAAKISSLDDELDSLYGGDVDEAVAETEVELDHGDSHRATLGNLATKGYRDATGAEVAFEVLPLNGVTMREGPVTVRNLHDVIPHVYRRSTGKEWTIKIWTAKGTDLSVIANAFFTVPNLLPLRNTGFLAMDGLEVIWAPKSPGNPAAHVQQILVNGEPLDLNRDYRVALTDGMLIAISIVDDLVNLLDLSRVDETGIEGWRSVLAFGMNTRTLTEDGLRAGGRSYTTTADPAVHRYGVRLSAAGLAVDVANEGLRATGEMTLACSHGPKDDYIRYDTSLEPAYTEFFRGPVAALAPGARAVVDVPWTPESGWYAVRCELLAAEDGYKGNSVAVTLLDTGSSR